MKIFQILVKNNMYVYLFFEAGCCFMSPYGALAQRHFQSQSSGKLNLRHVYWRLIEASSQFTSASAQLANFREMWMVMTLRRFLRCLFWFLVSAALALKIDTRSGKFQTNSVWNG